VNDERWKLADFGCTAEGTSKRVHLTEAGRGTARYRAPEVIETLSGGSGHYNNKADIWAFGCVAYELLTGDPAFLSDIDTHNYRTTRDPQPKTVFDFSQFPETDFPTVWSRRSPSDFPVDLARAISTKCVQETLRVSGEHRPSASELLYVLGNSG